MKSLQTFQSLGLGEEKHVSFLLSVFIMDVAQRFFMIVHFYLVLQSLISLFSNAGINRLVHTQTCTLFNRMNASFSAAKVSVCLSKWKKTHNGLKL